MNEADADAVNPVGDRVKHAATFARRGAGVFLFVVVSAALSYAFAMAPFLFVASLSDDVWIAVAALFGALVVAAIFERWPGQGGWLRTGWPAWTTVGIAWFLLWHLMYMWLDFGALLEAGYPWTKVGPFLILPFLGAAVGALAGRRFLAKPPAQGAHAVDKEAQTHMPRP